MSSLAYKYIVSHKSDKTDLKTLWKSINLLSKAPDSTPPPHFLLHLIFSYIF